MPRVWPDPRDNNPEPENLFKEVMVYFVAALIGAGALRSN